MSQLVLPNRVTVVDQFADHWSYGRGPYYDWCVANVSGQFKLMKYSRFCITATFERPEDATAFVLRWA